MLIRKAILSLILTLLITGVNIHAKETYHYDNGDKYVADFKGWRDGKGTFYFRNGDKYVGDFVKGTKTGKGTFYFSNGNKYVGGNEMLRTNQHNSQKKY